MKRILMGAAFALALGNLSAAQVTPPEVARQQAEEIRHGDPARWYQPAQGKQAQLANLRKEINAALAEAKQACKKQGMGGDSACMREARAIHQHDMSHLQEIHMATQDMSRMMETSGK